MTDLEALNREVAERVMGWECRAGALVISSGIFRIFKKFDGWSPATDIAAAFEVVEKLQADNPTYRFTLKSRPGMWLACFSFGKEACYESTGTIPEAICRAALQVVGAETP